MNSTKKRQALGFFQLVMINIIAVDSIRTLTFSAVYGFSLVFFYLVAAITFLIPTALVSAELGTGWPNRGGIYIWVREAFGKKISFFVIWLSWIYNIIWYPTILALIGGTFAYFVNPSLADNKVYMSLSVLILFWGATLINCFGMKASSLFSTLGAILGTIFPMVLISILGLIWYFKGNPMQIELSTHNFFPHASQSSNLAFLTNVLFGLLGLEMAATHAAEMRNPTRDYPRSLLVSVIMILSTIILGSLAIAIVVPQKELSLVTGVMQAFTIFADNYNLPFLKHFLAACIILGGLSCVGAWIIGPTKGLLAAAEDGSLPKIFAKTYKGVPISILLTQAIIVSFLCLAFILMPTINSSFWLLSNMTAQLALLVYLALFASAIKLFYHKGDVYRHFRIPGKKWGIWIVTLLGSLSSISVIIFGFIPPENIPIKNTFVYELILFGGMGLMCLLPFLLYHVYRRNK